MMAVVFMIFITLLVVEGFVTPLIREYQNANRIIKSGAAYYLAEAGIEDAYYRLKNEMSVSATETLELDGSTTTVTVNTISIVEKEVLSEAIVADHHRKIQVDISSSLTDVEFNYAAQIGQGGITLDENAEIRGAGGLPTEVYANGPVIGANNARIDGTANVAAGQLPDMAASSTLCDVDQIAGKNPENDVAQSFVPSDTEALSMISLYLKRVGQPNLKNVRIVADNGGVPDTTTLASAELNKNMGGTTYGWVDISFSAPATLTMGQTYWIVIDGSSHNSKYWHWCADSSAGYGSGQAAYTDDYSSGPWTGMMSDLAFKTHFGLGQSIIDYVEVIGDAHVETIEDSTVWGDAYYTNIISSTVLGTTYPGTPAPPSVPMPITDTMLSAWRADAEAGGIISGGCPGDPGCTSPIGPMKIDGDWILDINNETTILTGIVYVTGDVELANNNTLQCDPLYAERSCILLVDGTVKPHNNVFFNGSGNPASYVVIVSTIEDCVGGIQLPQCVDENAAIHMSQNVQGGLFYATDSLIYLDNNVDIVSAIAYRLFIYNGGYITYETGAADVTVNTGSDSGWHLNDWREVE